MRDDLLQCLELVRVHLMVTATSAACTVVHLAPLGGLLAGHTVKLLVELRRGGFRHLATVRMLLREKAIVSAKDGV